MRILILFSSSELGGAERSLSRMALSKSDIDYQLATIKSEGPWCDWVRSQGASPLIFGTDGSSHGAGGMPGAMLRLLRYLRANPVDIVYVCGVRASLWLRLCRFLFSSTKIVHGVRWNPASDSRLDRFLRFVERSTSFLIDAWITNSQATKDTLVKECKIADNDVHVIYNGIDNFPNELPNFNQRPFEILTVANLNPRKGHREYLSLIKAVVQRVPHARFVFVGRDDMNGAVQEMIKITGLETHVRYEGFQPDVAPWLRSARIFVLPSIWGEGCPTSILEAFSYGVPVISHAIDGVPELVENGVDGYLLQPYDTALADRIIDLLIDPIMASEMGTKARAKVADHFSLDVCTRAHMKTFDQVVSK